MEIRSDAVLPFPRALVFATYRDKLTELSPYLPNVTAIEIRERTDEPPVVRLTNVWHGAGEIPAVARKMIDERMLTWTDHACWNERDWTCEWRIETHVFTEAIRCRGRNRYVDLDGQSTRLEIRGDLEVDLKQVSAVPRFLAGKVGKTVEQVLVKLITPNLTRVSEGLATYLQQGGGG